MSLVKAVEQIIPKLSFKFPYTAEEFVEKLPIENYHSHSYYSNIATTDSPTSMEDYATRICQLNTKCLYTLEHSWQGNVFADYEISQKNNLKLVVGTEAYWVKNRHEQDGTNCHMVIQAMNEDGRQDINMMLSQANLDGYYYKPRIDLELLFQLNPKNVIVTSACVAGWKYNDAEEIWLKIAKYFGDHFFLEVQYHNTDAQKNLNRLILDMSKRYGIQIISGFDSHYIDTGVDNIKREKILEYKKMVYPDEDGWYLDYPDSKEAIRRFKEQGVLSDMQILEAIMNTNIFASEAVQPITFDSTFKIPTIYPNKTYDEKVDIFKHDIARAYKNEPHSEDRKEGIRFEVKQVVDSGVVDYFLTSKAIIDDAISNEGGIITTTSRGSAASFYINKLLGITTVDRFDSDVPIYPERFLTKDRVLAGSMPDIDSNIASQAPFAKAAKKILGEQGCYPLMAIEYLKVKNAWQMYASINNIEPKTANEVSKHIDEYSKAVKHADDDMKDDIHIEDYIPPEYIDVFNGSADYRGIVMNLKCHACGFLIVNGDIRRLVGLVSATSETTHKRTICAAAEGKYLDAMGYVKQDFLIVDSVSLTNELFQALGQPVPSFSKLKEMVAGDKPTWDIYENGYTVCVNQCEQAATVPKVMKYKPKNIAELAQFIAGIRPGFASLLNNFLNRLPYTTGEPQVDEILEDTSHYMIFQESIMKVLSFLGLPMGETYKVIKSISKKKLKGEKKEQLLQTLKKGWIDKFGNLDNFDRVWKVISDSAAYAFNAPHAYSMAGDSLYQAWFKAHHTALFYEVAIKHYQAKEKKDKIDALTKEALIAFDYRLGEYKFGEDNRVVHVDEERKIIIPNISSIKGLGDQVGETLYELGQNHYNSFVDLYKDLCAHKINKTVINNLTKIGYFKDYGTIPKLVKAEELFELLKDGEVKQISKDKAIENGIPFSLLAKYGNETAKQYNQIDGQGLLTAMMDQIANKPLSDYWRLRYECQVLGICKTILPKANKRMYCLVDMEQKKSLTNLTLYEIWSGNIQKVKMWNTTYKDEPIEISDIIYITRLDKKNKRERTDKINPKTGKYVYKPIPDEYEFWLNGYGIEDDESFKMLNEVKKI